VIPIKDNIPTDRFPIVTVLLIAANFIVYFLSIRHGGSIIGGPDTHEVVKYGAIPFSLTHPGKYCGVAEVPQFATVTQAVVCQGQPGVVGTPPGHLLWWETVFTSMFMHGSILHIAGNMLFLWIFGNNIEDAMGPIKFILFYLAGGVAALALQKAVGPHSTAPTIGASGAIAAVLGGYILLYPKARVLALVIIIFFFTVIELPAIVMLGVWFIEQAAFGAAGLTNPTGSSGGVAYFAHVGGFVFGIATVKLLATKRKQVPPGPPRLAYR
jgi:membrane associated rhomboid family serine protease